MTILSDKLLNSLQCKQMALSYLKVEDDVIPYLHHMVVVMSC